MEKHSGKFLSVLGLGLLLAAPGVVLGQGRVIRKGIQEAIEAFGKKSAAELAEEGAERTSSRLARLAAKHGDDVVPMLKELGPRAVRMADEMPEVGVEILRKHGRRGLVVLESQGKRAAQLQLQFGDEAMDLLIRHPGVGAELAEAYGKSALPAMSKLSSENAVRLAKLGPDFAKLPAESQRTLLDKLAQGGDDFVQWAWRRRVELFGTGAIGVGLITAYKVGDGVAAMVPQTAPPPDPAAHPYLSLADRWWWSFPVACLAGFALWLRSRREVRRINPESRTDASSSNVAGGDVEDPFPRALTHDRLRRRS